MLWACIRLPHLALDAVLRDVDDPTRPLALVTGPAQLRTLHAVNAAAAEAGLRPGMRLTAANAVSAETALHDHEPERDARAHRFLAAWAYRHSSLVSAQWPGAIVLEASASFRLFGPWPQLEAKLRRELDTLGFQHRIALAPTPRAAQVFAGLRDGYALSDRSALAPTLDRVPIRRAALPDEAGVRLHRMGIRSLKELRELPRDGIRRRFGLPLLDHLDRLYGTAEDPLDCYQPPDHFDSRVELGYEVESHQALLFPLRRLVSDLAVYLSARDGGVQRFVIRLEHEVFRHEVFKHEVFKHEALNRETVAGEKRHTDVQVGMLAAERDATLLMDIARNRLEQASIDKPVVGLRLLARELPPFVPAARDLFDTRPSQAMPWPQLRERLRARLGDDAVYRIAPTGDPRPERAWRPAGAEEDAACNMTAPTRPPRPTWLLEHPVPLRQHGLRIVSGPERLESGWWDDDDVRRDYYVLETPYGQSAWAYAAPGKRGEWMLHGWFA